LRDDADCGQGFTVSAAQVMKTVRYPSVVTAATPIRGPDADGADASGVDVETGGQTCAGMRRINHDHPQSANAGRPAIPMCSCGDRMSRTPRAPTEQSHHGAFIITVRNKASPPRLA
jgi:hypothetical protein